MAHSQIRGYAYGTCRLLGHMWEIVPSDWTPSFGVPMTCRCERCSIERRDTIGRNTGAVEARRYVYPSGYHIHHSEGIDTPTRTDFRIAWLEGVIGESRKRRAAARSTRQKG